MSEEPRTLPQLLGRAVETHGSRTALITMEERWTYAEVQEQVDRYSRSLVAMGVGKGSRVGLLMENVPEWIFFVFAATGLGALFVPLSTFSRKDDLDFQLRHADLQYLFMSERFLKNDFLAAVRAIAPELEDATPGALYAAATPALRRVVVRGESPLPSGCESWEDFEAAGEAVPVEIPRALRDEVDPEDECYLLYTSGTTAKPKGVLQVHDAVARNGYRIGEYQLLNSDDVAWFYYPMFFSAGCINVMLGTFSHGASLILQPTFDPGPAIELIEREKATAWHLWPHTLKTLTAHPDWQTKDHSTLHKGTAPFDILVGSPPPDGAGGVNMYGMTETCTAFSCTRADDEIKIRLTTNGFLMEDNQMKIIDPDSGERLADGEEGEICVQGPAVLRRYYKIDPSLIFDEEGFFHTGDLGHIDADGRMHFNQRIKDMIKTGGINVSPADIEAKLVGLEDVDVAYAFPIPAGDKGEAVGAALVVLPDRSPSDADLKAYFSENLPAYKRPEGVLLLTADQVPMTGSGKVQKVVLRDRLLERMKQEGASIIRA